MTAAAQPGKNPGKKQNTTPTSTPAEFEPFIDRAFHEHALARGAGGGASGAGVGDPPLLADLEPRALLRYASGRLDPEERSQVELFVGTQSSWGYNRVVALVRAARPANKSLSGGLARRLLEKKEQPALAAVAAAVLEAEGDAPGAAGKFAEAWRGIEKQGSPRARIACLLGLGRTDDAKKLLEKASPDDPVTTLFLSVTAAVRETDRYPDNGDEAPLLALLDVFPTLLGENEPDGAK